MNKSMAIGLVSVAACLTLGVARAEFAWGESAWVSAGRVDCRGDFGGRLVHGMERMGDADGGAAEAWDTTKLADGWQEVAKGTNRAEVAVLNGAGVEVEFGKLAGDTTWGSDKVHVVRDWVAVPEGVALEIGEGTVVKFTRGTGILVEKGGMLRLSGTREALVKMTSAADDGVGGDTDMLEEAPVGCWFVDARGTVEDTGWTDFGYVDTAQSGRMALSGMRVGPGRLEEGREARSGGVRLDGRAARTGTGARLTMGGEWATWNTAWDGAAKVAVTLERPDGERETLGEATESGHREADWKAEKEGRYQVEYSATDGEGAVLREQAVEFVKLGDEVVLHSGGVGNNETWEEGKVHVVDGKVSVGSGAALRIENGAVVKFTGGSSLVVSGGGTCVAHSVVFTHINDDAVGGDTMMDGNATGPVADAYRIVGEVETDGATQMRYLTETVSGTLEGANEWGKGRVIRVTGNVTVAKGATLTVLPGTIVKFDEGMSLTVNSGGTLNALGTRAQPIVFTSVKDDEFGGDTNGDGAATVAQPGDWARIYVGGMVNMDYCHIRYCNNNSDYGAIHGTGGTVKFDNGVIEYSVYECVRMNSGQFESRNSVFREASMGFGYYGGSGVYVYNGVVADCTTACRASNKHFYNTVFYRCQTFLESTSSSCDHCLFFNPVGYGAQSASQVGSSGNIWGNPLFVDADAGDFRVAEGSPCVDAGDTAVAPETDLYGQPRVSAWGEAVADIGVYEVQPRGVAGDVDLVPVKVSAEGTATPGGKLTVNWTVGNRGGKTADTARRDTVSLVSANGRSVALGDVVVSRSVAAGGTVECSGSFTVPAMAEGTWYPKVVVNSYQDVFEGSLVANNALTGADGVEVSVAATAASTGASGTVAAGVPTVLKLAFGAGNDNRMVILNVPAGVSVSWGFGFVPTADGTSGVSGMSGTTGGSGATGTSGTAEADGTPVQFVAPEDVKTVYVVLESGVVVPYTLTTESAKVAITSVEPAEVPSSGNATLSISGAGFTAGTAVRLVGNGATIEMDSVRGVDTRTISATVDCGKLVAGTSYDVEVEAIGGTVTAEKSVRVAAAPGEGKFWARLVVPDSVREGRKVACSVEYGNSGNADLPAQVLQINVVRSGALQYVGNPRNFQGIHFVATTTPQGGIAAGDSSSIPFVLVAGGNSEVRLYAGESADAEEFSLAAALVFARGSDGNDYRLVANELSSETAVDFATWQEYGEAFPMHGNDSSLLVDLGDFEEEAVSVTAKNIETAETYMAVSFDNGVAKFVGLPDGGYRIFAESEGFCGGMFGNVGGTVESVSVTMEPKLQVEGTVEDSQADDMVVFISEGGSYYSMVDGDGGYRVSLPAGTYDALVLTSGSTAYDSPEDLEIGADMRLDFPAGSASHVGIASHQVVPKAVPTRTDYNDSVWENKYTQARKRIDEGVRLLSLASAAYRPPTGEFDCPHNREIYWDNYRTAEMFRIRLFTFMTNARMADPYKALALLGKSVHDTARAYLDYWLASKTKFAEKRFHKWAGGIFNAEQKIGTYVSMKGVDLLEAKIGKFDTEVQSLQYLIDHRELSLAYVEQVLDKIASIKNGISGIQGDLDALKAAGTILTSDVSYLESSLFGDIWGYLNAASTIAELVSDWMKTGEAGGEWLAGRVHIDGWMRDFEAVMRDFAAWLPPREYLQHCCEMQDEEDIAHGKPDETRLPDVPRSVDPNEMAGPLGAGAARYVAPGTWMTYTVYFENKSDATAAAQEVYVTEQLSGALDWSMFEVVDVGFNNQIDLGLGGKRRGASETAMTGTVYKVRTTLDFDEKTGVANWYMRIVDEATETRWPKDVFAGFLPPNDDTGRGEGHITYRVKVREDAAAGTVIRASASIVFDYNAAIETDPAWWNTVAEMGSVTVDLGNGVATNVSVMIGAPWGGQLPDPAKRQGMRFAGWFTGPNGTGEEVTAESIVAAGAKLYAFWDASAAAELWLDVSWGAVEIGTNGVEKGYAPDGSGVEGSANRYVLTGTSKVHGVKFAGGSFTNTWTNLVIDLNAKDAVAIALEGANVEVELAGGNSVASGEDCAGIRVDAKSALTLQGTGRLVARGGKCGAGIGGGKLQESGLVEIHSGTVEACGGEYGAGIGGGLVAPAAGSVVITGGSVKARGSDGGEDIGGGFGREGTGVPMDAEGVEVHEVEVPWATDTEALPVVVVVEWGDGRTYRYEGMGHAGDSSLWFWLPDGTYDFEADGEDYGAHVSGASAVAVFTDPGSKHFESPAVEEVSVSETGWKVGLNPAYRTTPFDLWTATGLDGDAWAWEKVAPESYQFNAATGAVEWLGETKGVRMFRFSFRTKE